MDPSQRDFYYPKFRTNYAADTKKQFKKIMKKKTQLALQIQSGQWI